jgi:hypothetical protein
MGEDVTNTVGWRLDASFEFTYLVYHGALRKQVIEDDSSKDIFWLKRMIVKLHTLYFSTTICVYCLSIRSIYINPRFPI